MAFDGTLLSRPSGAGEAPIADALLVSYTGAYVPPPAVDVLSPNADGVDETQTLRYKVVRPSQVAATLIAPDGSARTLDAGARQPKTYRFDWDGKNADGTPAPEGTYRFSVSATDDLGRASSADRTFSLNTTLGFLTSPASAVVRRATSTLTASFTLAHPAQVTVTLERGSGAIVRTLLRASLAAGRASVRWNGRDANGVRASAGRYRLRVSATNTFGTVDLSRSLAVRRG
jgi:flagellar hook assembly protein FlgD